MNFTFKNIKRLLMPTKDNWFGWCSLVLTILIAFLWQINTPMHTDDFLFKYLGGDDFEKAFYCKGEAITSVEQLPPVIISHWQSANGRLSNIVYICSEVLPYNLVKVICGIMMGILAAMFWKWSGRKSLRNDALSAAFPLLYWTGMQWYDQMQSCDFQFNYTIPSIFIIGCLFYFFKSHRKPNAWAWILLSVFSLWHEGFTLIMLAFFGVQWLIKRDKTTFIVCWVLFAGALLQIFSGTQGRLNFIASESSPEFYQWTRLITESWCSIVAIVWWLIRRRKISNEQRNILDRFGLGLIGGWVVVFIMIFVIAPPQRAHWPNDVLAICFIILLLKTYEPLHFKMWIRIALTALYILWGSSLIATQYKVTEFTNYALSEIKKGNDVIKDETDFLSRKQPFWLMDMCRPQYNPFREFEHRALALGATNGDKRTYVMLPDSLYGKPFEMWPKLPGKNDLRVAGGGLLVRKHDGRKLTNNFSLLYFGAPSITTFPPDIILGYARGYSINNARHIVNITFQRPFEYMGDSLEVVYFNSLPRTVIGRRLIGVDYQ